MRKKSKHVVGILLSLVLAIGLMPGMSMTARAEEGQGQEGSVIVNNVEYLADRTFDGKEIMKEHDCIKITSDTTELKPGEWYVVDGEVNIEKRVEGPKKDRSDDEADKAHLILKDGAVLRIPKGIHGHCIDFYGQKNSTGQLIIDNVENGYQGIGTDFEESGFHDEKFGDGGNGGFFGFYGGTIRITGGKGAAAIYGVMNSFELKGGSLQITGGEGAPAESRVAMVSSVGVHVIAYEGDNNQGNVVYRGKSYPTWKDTNKLYFELADYHHTYRTTNEGRTVTLDCDVCNPTGTTPAGITKVTICAPTLKKYGETGEGINAEATLDYAGGQGRQMTDAAKISYFKTDSSGNKTGDALDKAPTDIGTYWAEFSLGEGENLKTAHVVYTIAKEVATGEAEFKPDADPKISGIESEQIENQLATIADAELKKETVSIGENQTREVKVSMEAQEISKENASNDVQNEINAIGKAAVKVIPVADQEGMEIAFLNINIKKAVIVKTVTNGQANGADPVWNPMTSLPQVVDVPVKFNMTGKFNAKVARYHDGVAQVFTKLKTRPAKNALKDGTYWVEGSGENTIVHIYSSEFSTYALFTSGTKEYVTEDTSNKTSDTQTPEVTNKDESVTVYRLYYVPTKEHFYTTDAYERSVLISKYGWIDEGVAWKSPKEPKTDKEKKTIKPVYRLFNPITTDHHYTTDLNERNTLIKKHGWIDESIAFYSNTKGETSVYRLWHPALITGAHHFTTSKYEYDVLTTRGWVGETEAFKVNAEK